MGPVLAPSLCPRETARPCCAHFSADCFCDVQFAFTFSASPMWRRFSSVNPADLISNLQCEMEKKWAPPAARRSFFLHSTLENGEKPTSQSQRIEKTWRTNGLRKPRDNEPSLPTFKSAFQLSELISCARRTWRNFEGSAVKTKELFCNVCDIQFAFMACGIQ